MTLVYPSVVYLIGLGSHLVYVLRVAALPVRAF